MSKLPNRESISNMWAIAQALRWILILVLLVPGLTKGLWVLDVAPIQRAIYPFANWLDGDMQLLWKYVPYPELPVDQWQYYPRWVILSLFTWTVWGGGVIGLGFATSKDPSRARRRTKNADGRPQLGGPLSTQTRSNAKAVSPLGNLVNTTKANIPEEQQNKRSHRRWWFVSFGAIALGVAGNWWSTGVGAIVFQHAAKVLGF
jgi:hypothetical protein